MRTLIVTFSLVPLFATFVRAERVPLSPEQKLKESTHVVNGVVKAIYSRDVESGLYGKGTIETQYLLEIEIQDIEKGAGLAKGDMVYARCWRIKKHGVSGPMPGPSGHFGIPNPGESVRAFLAKGKYGPTGQSDNGFAVVYPNGIEPVKAK
jgi:hypothetical protein